MKIILTNAFSANMLNVGWHSDVRFTAIAADVAAMEILRASEFSNCIGHADTDAVVRDMLISAYPAVEKKLTPGSRETVSLDEGTMLIVAQYKGQRLPEGATSLPDGATIEFLAVAKLPRLRPLN